VVHDPAAAAALPVDISAFARPGSASSTQPTHPLQVTSIAAAVPGDAAAAAAAAAADWYQQQQPPPAAAAAAAGVGSIAYHPAAPRQPIKAAGKASSGGSKNMLADKMVAVAVAAQLLNKRDKSGRFYKKEHMHAWARLLYERGQLQVHGMPDVSAQDGAAAAAAQDTAMALGQAKWPLPPWVRQQREDAAAAAAAAANGGAVPSAAAAAAPRKGAAAPGSKVAAAAAAAAKKAASSSGTAVTKKAQPAVLVSAAWLLSRRQAGREDS
jgi:hypothetical protein